MDPNLKALHLGLKALHLGHKTLLMAYFFKKKVYSDFEVQAGFIKYVLYLYLVGKLKICMTYNSQSIAQYMDINFTKLFQTIKKLLNVGGMLDHE